MTHKDAMEKAREVYLADLCYCIEDTDCTYHQRIAAALIAVRKETREQDAKYICAGCGNGVGECICAELGRTDAELVLRERTCCPVCAERLVKIRGRYPHTDRRQVCPTCAVDRLEQIREISSPDYGQAAQAQAIRKEE